MTDTISLLSPDGDRITLLRTPWGWMLGILDVNSSSGEPQQALLTPQNMIDLHAALGEILERKS